MTMFYFCWENYIYAWRDGGHIWFWAPTVKAQGDFLELSAILTQETSNYLRAKILLSLFFFQVDPNFDLMLLG